MAAVYKHKSRGFQVRFKLYFPDGSEVTRYRYVPTRSEAESLCRDCEFLEHGSRSGRLSQREVVQGRHDGLISEQEALLLSDGKIITAYDLEKVIANYKVSSAIANTKTGHDVNIGRLKFIVPWFEENPIPSLSVTDVKLYIHQRLSGERVNRFENGWGKVGVVSKTVKNEIEIIRGVIDEAVLLKMVSTNVARDVDVLVKSSKFRKACSHGQLKQLLECANNNRHLLHGQMYEALMIDLLAGLRRAELQTLEWADLEFDSRIIKVQAKTLPDGTEFTTKNGEAEPVSMPDELYDILQSMERRGRFVLGGDVPYSLKVISRAFKKLLVRAGLAEFSLHHIRHTYISWLLKHTKGDIKYVQAQARHSDPATTAKYMHVVEDEFDPARKFGYNHPC